MKQRKEPKEIKISQNYFINQINITNLKNRLIKQTKNKRKEGNESSEEHSVSNLEKKIEKKFENEKANIEEILDQSLDANVKIESESEIENLGKIEELDKLEIIDNQVSENYYFKSRNLNHNRLQEISKIGIFYFKFQEKNEKIHIKTKVSKFENEKEMSNKDLIDTLKQKFGEKNLKPSASYLGKQKKRNIFSKPKSFDLNSKKHIKNKSRKISEMKKQKFVKKYSEGFSKLKKANRKTHNSYLSFYDSLKKNDQ